MNTQASELIETEVVLPPAFSLNRARVLAKLLTLLTAFEDRYHCLPQLECSLPTGSLIPDLALVPMQQYNWERDVLRYPQPPITVIEVLSPTQALYAVAYNLRNLYLAGGVQSAWLVIPSITTVYVFLADGTTHTFSTGILRDPASSVEIEIGRLFC